MADRLSERLARTLAGQIVGDAEAWLHFTDLTARLLDEIRMPSHDMIKSGSDVPVGCCTTTAEDARLIWDRMVGAASSETIRI